MVKADNEDINSNVDFAESKASTSSTENYGEVDVEGIVEREELKKEKLGFIGAIKKFMGTEVQEEDSEQAVTNYKLKENKKHKKNSNSSGFDEEEQEELRETKKELLNSLRKVEVLEKNIFYGKEFDDKK